jgi:hypothetical protein
MIKTAQDAYLAGRQAALVKIAYEKQAFKTRRNRPPMKESLEVAAKGTIGGGLAVGGLLANTHGLASAMGGKFKRGLRMGIPGTLATLAGMGILGSIKGSGRK